ncbi:peptidase [Bacillus spizizenii]|nr:peptidase [Bacillus spizizenii]MCY8415719.1 peptidase [Bacillus spizizenii]MEC0617768.1 peptidase [Bacillus spizizenii]MEC0640738.1 peptidase [Bacillus spizizenii]MEC0653288.1 peptidase [Bacillus spizizenii]
MKILKYEDEEYEVILQNNVFIKDKKSGEYYKNNLNSLTDEQLLHFEIYKEKVSPSFFYLFLFFTATMFLLNYIHLIKLQNELTTVIFGWEMWIIIAIYFIMNIVLHEMGHIYSLKFFGKNFDKFGFKLNFYVFPAFYVQLNETYMLSRNEKIIVHLFGLFINYFIINILEIINLFTISSEPLTMAFMLFSSTLLWNLVPILNSDGYKILLAFLSLDEYSRFKTNHWLVLTIQIIGVGLAVNSVVHWILYIIK